jgi:hypothetical protein
MIGEDLRAGSAACVCFKFGRIRFVPIVALRESFHPLLSTGHSFVQLAVARAKSALRERAGRPAAQPDTQISHPVCQYMR